jgi:hypothetical protein
MRTSAFSPLYMIMLCISICGILFSGGSVLGYLEDKMYCKFEGEQLTLYVKKEEGLQKCEVYIQSLEQLTQKKYDEVMLTLEYINQGDDEPYRRGVFELTKQEFLKLVRYRTMIVEMIQAFEEKFFLKYQEALTQSLMPYLTTLDKLSSLRTPLSHQSPGDEPLQIMVQQIQQQIFTITMMLQATSLDEIMQRIPAYLYLKQQLA